MEPNESPIQWVPGSFPWGVKRPGREADNSLPSRVILLLVRLNGLGFNLLCTGTILPLPLPSGLLSF
jgi:hypothetical protein